jgi:hypothetical protein
MVTVAEAISGKTTLLSLVGFLVPRSLPSVGVSEAALYRSIELWNPTIIADECDTLLADNEPLRAVINSGWNPGQVREFSMGAYWATIWMRTRIASLAVSP